MREAQIPGFLSHLRRDRRGIPVPYVNRWGRDERTVPLAIQRDPNIGARAVFQLDVNEPEPDFTSQNMQRQRECMVQGRCQVCGQMIPTRFRHLVIAALVMEQQNPSEVGGTGVLIFEPWLHQRCAEFAIRYCPALIRRRREEALELVHLPNPKAYRRFTSSGWVEGEFEAETRAAHVAMWVKIQLLDRALVLTNSVSVPE